MTIKPMQISPSDKAKTASSRHFPGFAEHRLALDDQVVIAYVDNHLDAPPLLLLHGIFDNKTTWFRLASRLQGYRLIAPDLVGHGFSSKPHFADRPATERYSPDMQVDFLKAFIDALDLDELVLVGNSLGGGLALRLYLRSAAWAAKVRGLVLIDAAGHPVELPGHVREFGRWQGRLMTRAPVRLLARWLGLIRLSTRHTFRRCFYDPNKIPPELLAEAHAALKTSNIFYAYHLSAQNIEPPDIDLFHRRFAEITCPTLVLWGRQDRILHPLSALLFDAEIPQSELHLFDRCGHAPHLEYPDEVAALIDQWLKKHR